MTDQRSTDPTESAIADSGPGRRTNSIGHPVAVCLYNRTGEWSYIFTRIDGLRRLATDDRYLEPIQVIPQPIATPWTTDMPDLL